MNFILNFLLFSICFRNTRSRSFSPDSSDFGNSPIKSSRGRSRSRSNSPAWSPARNSPSYFAIGNLTRNVNEGHLREIFGVYGEIVAVVYPMHPITGYPVGKAVIHYKEMVSVENALKGMNGGQIDGNVIECHVSKYPEPLVKSIRPREPRNRGKRHVHGRIDHYAPAAGRRDRSRTPVRRSPSPIRRRVSPSRSPIRSGRRFSPRRYSRSPRRYSRSPRRYSRSPRRISRSPMRRISRSPRRFSRSPRRFSRSPRRYSPSRSRSPIRRVSRSPVRRRSPSPRYRRRSSFSRSPIRHRSPSYSRSRSPPSRYPRHIERSPRRFSPRRSLSRSPIPVSRMNY